MLRSPGALSGEPTAESFGMFRKLDGSNQDPITVYIDGSPVAADANESVAAVLLRMDPLWARTTPVSASRRAPYCMMGVCFDCLAIVDGISSVQTCLTSARDGMKIERQLDRPDVAP